jgi:ribulose kinase
MPPISRVIGLASWREGFARIGTDVRPMGERIGLLADAARELGLVREFQGVSITDAHAGGLGFARGANDIAAATM